MEVVSKEVARKSVAKVVHQSSSNKAKRKERTAEDKTMVNGDVEDGSRLKVKFKGGVWYKGSVSSVVKGNGGEVVKVGISYDDGDEEESDWPDEDIVLIDGYDDDNGNRRKIRKEKE